MRYIQADLLQRSAFCDIIAKSTDDSEKGVWFFMKKISEFLQAEDTCGNLYHFSYDEPEENANHDTMEEVLNRCAKFLRKREFIREPRGEMVVIGIDDRGHWNLLNTPEEWAIDVIMENASKLGKIGHLCRKRIVKVRIYNLCMPFDVALVLEANAQPLARRYLALDPVHFVFNTQEFGLLLDVMVAKRLIRVGNWKDLVWVRKKYHND